jgi:hypothetical protein
MNAGAVMWIMAMKGNTSSAQNENADKVLRCSDLEVCMLIFFGISQV